MLCPIPGVVVGIVWLISTASYDLPDDIFGEGEVKPTRPHKKKTINGAAKKRAANEVCNELAVTVHIDRCWTLLAVSTGLALNLCCSSDVV